jgi:hypothetical protein
MTMKFTEHRFPDDLAQVQETVAHFPRLVILLMSLSLPSVAAGVAMQKQTLHLCPFSDFNVEAQDFQVGLGEENFQISVPRGERLDQISFLMGGIKRERIELDDDGVGTSYATVPLGGKFLFLEGCGAALFKLGGSKKFWSDTYETRTARSDLDGPAIALPNGKALAFMSYLEGRRKNEMHMVQFQESSSIPSIVLALPKENENGVLDRLYLHDGFLAIRHPRRNTDPYQPPQFYDWDGKPQPHLLANALSLLHKSQIDLRSSRTGYEQGAFHVSQSKDVWGLFRWEGMPQFGDKRLFLLSVTDTVQVLPVSCGSLKMDDPTDLNFVLIHPHLNLFLVGVKDDGDRVFLYLGHVRRDPEGKAYVAQTYQIGFFDEVVSPIFSRNGEVLLFATRTGLKTNLVFSRLTDLLAEANRRYPEAKLDLDSLKAEVR